MADRECDIYEFLQAAVDEKSKFVARSCANRRTHECRAIDSSTIGDKLAVSPDLGTIIINKDRKLRDFHVRSMSTCLRPPQRSPDAKSMPLSALSVCIVEVREVGSNEDPIHWRLITNLPVKNYDDACEIIGIYRQRRNIECFHRILKSGFSVEKARLKNRKRLENLISMLSIMSWHIFWLYQLGRNFPSLDAAIILDKITVKVLKKSAGQIRVPIQGDLLIGDALLIIARLRGFLARRGDGNLGMMSIWRGWRCLHERIEFMEAMTYG